MHAYIYQISWVDCFCQQGIDIDNIIDALLVIHS